MLWTNGLVWTTNFWLSNGMAFLPALTTERSAQNVKRTSKRSEASEANTKSGYRVSFADINNTPRQSCCSSSVTRCPNDGNTTGKRDTLPPLEKVKGHFVAKRSYNEEETKKPLKLPKCPSHCVNKKAMFWIDPLGLWVPIRQGRRLYEKFSSAMDLLYKDPDYLMDPCPHIPRCDHSRSWSAVKLERQRLRELRQLRNEQLLQKTMESYQNMQELWLEQVSHRSEMLHATPSHVRLQNFRKSAGRFLPPLNEAQRLVRLRERQREWEEAWRQACEKQKKVGRIKNAQKILPRILVTEYEFVVACDEHVDTNNQPHDMYFEESYEVVCRPVQYISDEDLKRQSHSKQMQRFQGLASSVCDPHSELDLRENVTTSFDPSEKEQEENFTTTESKECDAYPRLDHTEVATQEALTGKRVDSPRGENVGPQECEKSMPKSDNAEDPSLVNQYTGSGSSLETVVAEMIKQAENTADLMSQLVPAPLGVSSGEILDPQLTASSELDVYHTANQARLHNEKQGKNGGAWLPKKRDANPFLQIDVGHVTTVQQIATQGNPPSAVKSERHKRWVKKFSLEFSQDGKNWTQYQESGELKVFTGNFDLDSVVLNSLENAVEARYIRLRPKEWHNGIAMRVEVFGSNPLAEVDVAEKEKSITPEENSDGSSDTNNSNDDAMKQCQETEMFFSEVDTKSENVEFGLFVEEHAVTPSILHSPAPSLLSTHDQRFDIEYYMESEIHTQELHLKESYDVSDANSSTSHGDDSLQCSSVNIEPFLNKINSEPMTPEETQELDSQLDEQESDITDNDRSAPTQSPPRKVSITPEDTPPPTVPTPPTTVPTPPPTSPPLESWVHALERARADGSIQRQLMREKMAEERRKKLAMLDSKRKVTNAEQRVITESVDELGYFLEKYCIITKLDENIYRNIFEKFDEDNDGFLWPEEVLEALENVNTGLLSDAHLRYVFRVLEQCECQADIGIGFRLFSVIAAMSQRVASLNDKMKKLISKCDFKTLDCTLERVKMLFECYVNEDTMLISRTDLWIGLAAGGLRSAEATIDDFFSEKFSFDFLDFLTYLPLFQEIHGHVVENPLSLF